MSPCTSFSESLTKATKRASRDDEPTHAPPVVVAPSHPNETQLAASVARSTAKRSSASLKSPFA